MIVIVGLVILAAAGIASVGGALAMAGLSMLLAGARRTSRRGRAARQSLRQSRRETAAVSADRDDLTGQRATARAYTVHDEQRNFTASTLGNGDGPRTEPAGFLGIELE